ncbi:hypothetical protein [Bradyrhizobium sp. LHD-71]|uniref:hypothetical protein n=1 Tax=Bradyrhizobium sp. LHD-71 TaxID=3072141 RepID=UPI00280C6530|nr:hypothetical protein [Bradyrhizobium sp. LHD-71]MDQ8730523.1 hypothetical protein [Bradyrhizobium sp. LHD-71]
MAADDDKLRFIERIVHRQHVVKITRRRDQIKLLIYPPNANLATRMVVDALTNYERAIGEAKAVIDDMVDGTQPDRET